MTQRQAGAARAGGCGEVEHTAKVAVRMIDGSPDLYVLAVCGEPAGHYPATQHHDTGAGWRWG